MSVDISTVNHQYVKSIHVFDMCKIFFNAQRKIIKFCLTNTGPLIVTEITEIP